MCVFVPLVFVCIRVCVLINHIRARKNKIDRFPVPRVWQFLRIEAFFPIRGSRKIGLPINRDRVSAPVRRKWNTRPGDPVQRRGGGVSGRRAPSSRAVDSNSTWSNGSAVVRRIREQKNAQTNDSVVKSFRRQTRRADRRTGAE